MKVILQERVANLGNVGDQVDVKPGYGRNYLIPYNLAVAATSANIAEFESRRSDLERRADQVLQKAKQRAEQLAALTVSIEALAGEEGKLFGSVGPRDIAQAVTSAGVEVEKKEVTLPEGPIRHIGEFTIVLRLHSEVNATVKIIIVPTAAQ